MPNAARKLDYLHAEDVAPAAPGWSGDVHGPVAALHRAIEDGLALGVPATACIAAQDDVVERWLRLASRATGWGVLTAAFAGTIALIF